MDTTSNFEANGARFSPKAVDKVGAIADPALRLAAKVRSPGFSRSDVGRVWGVWICQTPSRLKPGLRTFAAAATLSIALSRRPRSSGAGWTFGEATSKSTKRAFFEDQFLRAMAGTERAHATAARRCHTAAR